MKILKLILIGAVGAGICAGVSYGAWLKLKHAPATPAAVRSKDTVKPTLQLTLPAATVIASASSLRPEVKVSDNRQVSRVEYRIDNVFVAVSYSAPFTASIDTSMIAAGQHTLTAIAYDAAGNTSTPSTQTFNVTGGVANVAPSPEPGAPPAQYSVRQAAKRAPAAGAGTPSLVVAGDATPPTAPTGIGLSQTGEGEVTVSWLAASDNIAVTGYEVWRNGTVLAQTAGLNRLDQTAAPGHTYTYQIRARDAAGNWSGLSAVATITLAQLTVFASDAPIGAPANDSGSTELGVHIRPLRSGVITGIRFYKGTGNGGTHVGNLWAMNGTNLASATFASESASGWQTASFATPVAITAGSDYIASYLAPQGHYYATADVMAYSQFTSQYLIAPADGEGGGNGLFRYSASSIIPNQTFNTTNYWVDALFTPDSLVDRPVARSCPAYPAFPDANCTGVIPGSTMIAYTGTINVTRDNTVLYNLDVTGSVRIMASNVKMINCKIHDNNGGIAIVSGNVTITDTDLYNSYGAGILFDDWTGQRLNIHSMYEDGVKFGNNATLQDSWIHDFTPALGAHADGGQMQNGRSNILVKHNHIDVPENNSALFFAPDLGPTSSGPITIDRNLVGGGGYTVYMVDGNSGVYHQSGYTVTNNRFIRNYNYGPLNINEPAASFDLWSNNVWDDTGQIIPGP